MTVLALLFALATPDPHSLANPAVVTTTHLALDLSLDFTAHRIQGSAELTLAYPGDKAAARELFLDTRDLTITQVVDAGSGRELAFALDPAVPLLGQRLRITLPLPRPDKLRIRYLTSPQASALQWTSAGRLPFLFTQAESIHARSFIPCIDSPGVRISYAAVVRVPPGMTVVMAAEHGQHEPARGIYHFRMDKPIPAYLIALAAGDLAFRALSERTGVWAQPALLEPAASEFRDMEQMLRAAESLFGPYVWGRWDILVMPPSFPFGGMENPRLTFATPSLLVGDRSLVNVLAHELAHSWSGNLVTSASWSDFWLNEGFTRYLEQRIMEVLYGPEAADMQVLLSQRRLRREVEGMMARWPAGTALDADYTGRDPEDSTNGITYEKGAAFLRVLEKHFGSARFDGFLRAYFAANAFKSMDNARFLAILKQGLFQTEPEAWALLRVDEWAHGTGIPDNLDVPVSARFARTRAAAEAFSATGTLAGVGSEWSTAEWVEFLGSLPAGIDMQRLAALDAAHHLTETRNPEVLVAWLGRAARAEYEPAYATLEAFLTRQGRTKYVRPLYQALMQGERTRELGRRIYARARPGYHPLTARAIDALMP